MKDFVRDRLNKVRDALHEAGQELLPDDWKSLLEELGADVDGHLDAIREEAENSDEDERHKLWDKRWSP